MKLLLATIFSIISICHGAPELLDTNYVYACFKVGDQGQAASKPSNQKYYNGMLVDVLDPMEWKNKQLVLADQMKKVYCIVKYPRAKKAMLRAGALKIGTLADTNTLRASSLAMNYDQMGAAIGEPNLIDTLQSTKAKPIYVNTLISDTILKDCSKIDFTKLTPVVDKNTISSGVNTYGSGGSYATRKLIYADVAATLTGNLTCHQLSATSEVGSQSVICALATFTFKDSSGLKSFGNPNGGYISGIKHATLNDYLLRLSAEGPGVQELDGLYLRADTAYNGTSLIYIDVINVADTVKIHDCMFNGTSGGASLGAVYLTDADPVCYVWNIKAYAFKYSSAYCAIYTNAANSSSKFENITVDNSSIVGSNVCFFGNNQSVTFRNCVGLKSSTGSVWSTVGTNTIGRNCAADDATADDFATHSGEINSITPANEFQSLTASNAQYLDLKTDGSSTLDAGGVTVAIPQNTTGMRANANGRAGSTPSVGADEYGTYPSGNAGASIRRIRLKSMVY